MNATQTPTATEWPTITGIREMTPLEANTATAHALEGLTSWYKSRDDYGRTVRRVETWEGGKRLTKGVVVLLPKGAEKDGKRYMANEYSQNPAQPHGTITHHAKLSEALRQLNGGPKESQLYRMA